MTHMLVYLFTQKMTQWYSIIHKKVYTTSYTSKKCNGNHKQVCVIMYLRSFLWFLHLIWILRSKSMFFIRLLLRHRDLEELENPIQWQRKKENDNDEEILILHLFLYILHLLIIILHNHRIYSLVVELLIVALVYKHELYIFNLNILNMSIYLNIYKFRIFVVVCMNMSFGHFNFLYV